MTDALYILGAPGTGKSTLLADLLRGYTPLAPVPLTGYGQMTATPLTLGGHLEAWTLGRIIGGTDTLSFNVHPHALQWALNGHLPRRLYGEGHRLGTPGFLRALNTRTTLTVLHLTADRDILATRSGYTTRDQQVTTKAAAAAQAASEAGATVHHLSTNGTPAEVLLQALVLLR